MKILLIAQRYPPFVGGVEVQLPAKHQRQVSRDASAGTLDALKNSTTPSDVAAKRGKSVEEILG